VEAIQQLEDAARTMRARNWAAYLSERASEAWDFLVSVLSAPRPYVLVGCVQDIQNFFVPLEDTPEELFPARDRVRAALKALAVEKKRVIVPMIGPDRDLREDLISPLGAMMVDVARDLDHR